MFAVIKTGGKQYLVRSGDKLKVEKLEGKEGDKLVFSGADVLANSEAITPEKANTDVNCKILEQGKAEKIIVFKKKRRQNYRRKAGHRQRFTLLEVTSIGNAKAVNANAKATAKTDTKTVTKATATETVTERTATKTESVKTAKDKKPEIKTEAKKA